MQTISVDKLFILITIISLSKSQLTRVDQPSWNCIDKSPYCSRDDCWIRPGYSRDYCQRTCGNCKDFCRDSRYIKCETMNRNGCSRSLKDYCPAMCGVCIEPKPVFAENNNDSGEKRETLISNITDSTISSSTIVPLSTQQQSETNSFDTDYKRDEKIDVMITKPPSSYRSIANKLASNVADTIAGNARLPSLIQTTTTYHPSTTINVSTAVVADEMMQQPSDSVSRMRNFSPFGINSSSIENHSNFWNNAIDYFWTKAKNSINETRHTIRSATSDIAPIELPTFLVQPIIDKENENRQQPMMQINSVKPNVINPEIHYPTVVYPTLVPPSPPIVQSNTIPSAIHFPPTVIDRSINSIPNTAETIQTGNRWPMFPRFPYQTPRPIDIAPSPTNAEQIPNAPQPILSFSNFVTNQNIPIQPININPIATHPNSANSQLFPAQLAISPIGNGANAQYLNRPITNGATMIPHSYQPIVPIGSHVEQPQNQHQSNIQQPISPNNHQQIQPISYGFQQQNVPSMAEYQQAISLATGDTYRASSSFGNVLQPDLRRRPISSNRKLYFTTTSPKINIGDGGHSINKYPSAEEEELESLSNVGPTIVADLINMLGCRDHDQSVCESISEKMCMSRPGYYLKLCPVKCKNCNGLLCFDSNKIDCAKVAEVGGCRMENAAEYCPQTCGKCPQPSFLEQHLSPCRDELEMCANLAESGACTHPLSRPTLRIYCPQSCDFCKKKPFE